MAYKTPTAGKDLKNSDTDEKPDPEQPVLGKEIEVRNQHQNHKRPPCENDDKGDKKKKNNIRDKLPNPAVVKESDSRERACKMAVSVKGVPITDMKSYLARKKMEREKKLRNEAPISGAASSRGKLKN